MPRHPQVRTDLLPRCRTSGKVSYRSATRARRAAVIFMGHGSQRQRPYLCPGCGAWHLTRLTPEGYAAATRTTTTKEDD